MADGGWQMTAAAEPRMGTDDDRIAADVFGGRTPPNHEAAKRRNAKEILKFAFPLRDVQETPLR